MSSSLTSSSSPSSSGRSQAVRFAQMAESYRIFWLEDLLSEPHELAYDPVQELIYFSKRCVQGHAAAPVEYSTHVAVLDVSTTRSTSGTWFPHIELGSYAGPHGLEMIPDYQSGGGGYLDLDVENDGQSGKGNVRVDLGNRMVVSYVPASGQAPAPAGPSDFIAEVDLRRGRILRSVTVPDSEVAGPGSNIGTGRFIQFSTPAIQFAARGNDRGLHVLDERDPVVQILRRVLRASLIYIVSRNVLLI